MASRKRAPKRHPLATLTQQGFDWAELLSRQPEAKNLAPGSWVFDTGEGRNVRAQVKGATVSFDGHFDSTRLKDIEHGGYIENEGANDILYDTVELIARPLLERSRGTLTLENGDEIAPEEPCEQCESGLYYFEEVCPSCGAEVGSKTEKKPKDNDDLVAERLVGLLIQGGHMSLRKAKLAGIESFVAAYMANFRPKPLTLMNALLEQPEVEEIYCDDETFSELVERASNEKRLRRG